MEAHTSKGSSDSAQPRAAPESSLNIDPARFQRELDCLLAKHPAIDDLFVCGPDSRPPRTDASPSSRGMLAALASMGRAAIRALSRPR